MPKKENLGRALTRQNKQKDKRLYNYDHAKESSDWCRLPIRSITQETTLDEFIHTATLSNTDFAAQKMDAKVLSKAEIVGVISAEERARRKSLMEKNKGALTVLKRPKIGRTMTKEEIVCAEQEAYLSWRKDLARLEQIDGIVMTPYERNLEFWRQLWQVVERSEILIQVVDARQPLLFFSSSLNDYVKEVDPRKETLVLINKSDFLTKAQRNAWAKYFESAGIRVFFFSALNAQSQDSNQSEDALLHPSITTEQKKSEVKNASLEDPLSVTEMCMDFDETGASSSDESTLQDETEEESVGEDPSEVDYVDANDGKVEVINGCDLLSVRELIDEFVRLGPRREGCSYLTVGFLGYPNVGKSSTLNALCGAKRTSVSATPGKTKHFQTIFLQSDLQLCDCPGMVMPSFAYTREDLVVAGILPIDEMRDYISPIRVICEQIPREVFSALYGISIRPPKDFEDPHRPPTPHELLAAYACMRGFMSAKGNPHYDRAARIILKDYVKGRLRYCHSPPGVDVKDYQMMGLVERLSDGGDAIAVAMGKEGEMVQGEEAKTLFSLSAYLAPTELHKLWHRLLRQRHRNAETVSKDKAAVVEEEERNLMRFDRIALAPQSQVCGRQLIRSKKKFPTALRNLGDPSEDGDDAASTASWSTMTSNATSGGASLLSGASSEMAKKPWRQLSAAKKFDGTRVPGAGAAGIGRNRKKKEKLRRVYADLDRHEVE